jgi:hypothetical protein
MEHTDQSVQSYEARRKRGGFMQHKVETTLPDGTIATMNGGVLIRDGDITMGEKTYQVTRKLMSDGLQGIADYAVNERFMRLTIATITDLERKRSYTFRQRRCWSSTLVLLENNVQVGEFRSNLIQSPYRIQVSQDVSTNIVLLCVWIAMVQMAFAA